MKIEVKANAFCPDNCIYCKYDFKMVEEGYYPVCKLKKLCEENFKKGMIFERNHPDETYDEEIHSGITTGTKICETEIIGYNDGKY